MKMQDCKRNPAFLASGALLRGVKHADFFDALVHPVDAEHDLALDLHILKGGVGLDELHVLGDELVNHFGLELGAGRAVLGHVAVDLAKLVVSLRLDRVPHLHGVPDFHLLGQGADVLASQPARGGVQRVNVKARIVGDDGDDVHVVAQVLKLVHDLEKGLDDALALGNVLVVGGQLVRVVGGLHALGLTEKDFADDVGTLQDDLASAGAHNGEADVIGQIVGRSDALGLDDVAGLAVQNDGVILLHDLQPFLRCSPRLRDFRSPWNNYSIAQPTVKKQRISC